MPWRTADRLASNSSHIPRNCAAWSVGSNPTMRSAAPRSAVSRSVFETPLAWSGASPVDLHDIIDQGEVCCVARVDLEVSILKHERCEVPRMFGRIFPPRAIG